MPEVTKSNNTKGLKPGAVAALTSTTRLAPATAAKMSTTRTSSSAAVLLKIFRVNANCIARPCRGIPVPLERIRGAAKAAIYRRVAVAKGWNVSRSFAWTTDRRAQPLAICIQMCVSVCVSECVCVQTYIELSRWPGHPCLSPNRLYLLKNIPTAKACLVAVCAYNGRRILGRVNPIPFSATRS